MAKKGGCPQNLRTPTTEEARIIGSMGGKKSAEVRNKVNRLAEEKADQKMGDCFREFLNKPLSKVQKTENEILNMFKVPKNMRTQRRAMTAIMVMKAVKGSDLELVKFIRDTIGEKPAETVDTNLAVDGTGLPVINFTFANPPAPPEDEQCGG